MKTILAVLILFFVNTGCYKAVNDPMCTLKPDSGPCKASIKKYYFDQTTKKCMVFTWGGCKGVVPFETLEACNQKCPCQGN
ncbi:MAG: BPTI/Kunitz domain-containing protein [Saprospiraceae bacterium]|jgi:hypothetical protein|nr:BPTI/Kunitz domain-containing protein [Saprospiraceae bacterium]MBL0100748.1 BPTI/Kunitz domain-containing protein [Saprospiraceae bacterium]